eukprot:CAMPEP_0183740912 /NCGR_PEP_ID=MMETSP0737-20130205/60820_1 /TAXON_ID=385413 /ORGANISM="Thalassiosira miniscula, Strain CCMP1093" /LENGTH=57 /DNA_ID=CAMNT_0025976091 /DNA_START=77 /DNA_END=247 /DNA_ORIENTATION=+
MTATHINLQPSFRGALHARDGQAAASSSDAPHITSIDPSPLLGEEYGVDPAINAQKA